MYLKVEFSAEELEGMGLGFDASRRMALEANEAHRRRIVDRMHAKVAHSAQRKHNSKKHQQKEWEERKQQQQQQQSSRWRRLCASAPAAAPRLGDGRCRRPGCCTATCATGDARGADWRRGGRRVRHLQLLAEQCCCCTGGGGGTGRKKKKPPPPREKPPAARRPRPSGRDAAGDARGRGGGGHAHARHDLCDQRPVVFEPDVPKQASNVDVCVDLDADAFKKLYAERVLCPPSLPEKEAKGGADGEEEENEDWDGQSCRSADSIWSQLSSSRSSNSSSSYRPLRTSFLRGVVLSVSAATSLLVAQGAAGPSLGPLLSGAFERGLGLVPLLGSHLVAGLRASLLQGLGQCRELGGRLSAASAPLLGSSRRRRVRRRQDRLRRRAAILEPALPAAATVELLRALHAPPPRPGAPLVGAFCVAQRRRRRPPPRQQRTTALILKGAKNFGY